MGTVFKRKLLIKFGILLSSGLALACQSSPHGTGSQVKIVGGSQVSSDDPVAQSTVALVISMSQGTALCTGSLIDARHVVSAGHCLASDPQGAVVEFGLSVSRDSQDQRAIQTFSVNQNYGGSPPSDISLITLSEDAPAGYAPVPILSASEPLNDGETVTLAGYGQTNINDTSTTHLLRKVDTQLVTNSAATEELEVGDTPGRGACHGDSGGPAFVNRNGQLYLVGVTSRDTNPDGRCENNTIYTDVRYYQDWIAATEAQ